MIVKKTPQSFFNPKEKNTKEKNTKVFFFFSKKIYFKNIINNGMF